MNQSPFSRLFAALTIAAVSVGGVCAAPQAAMAQTYDQPAPSQTYGEQPYYDPCRRDQNGRAVAGGVLGGIAGAVIGSNLAHGGGRPGGAVIGGLAGAALGAGVGKSTAGCDAASDQAPAPAPGYYAPPPPAMQPQYPEECATAEVRIYYPDGSMERHPERACRDSYGRFHLVHRTY